jgi:alkaline phosphatase
MTVNVTKQFFFAAPIVAKHSGTNLVIKTADHETDSLILFINLI